MEIKIQFISVNQKRRVNIICKALKYKELNFTKALKCLALRAVPISDVNQCNLINYKNNIYTYTIQLQETI